MRLNKAEREGIAAKIDNEGFEYYFTVYGPDEKLVELVGVEIAAFKTARNALINALAENGVEIE